MFVNTNQFNPVLFVDPEQTSAAGFDFCIVANLSGFSEFTLAPLQLMLQALAEVLQVRERSDLTTSQIWGSCGTMPLKPSRFEF